MVVINRRAMWSAMIGVRKMERQYRRIDLGGGKQRHTVKMIDDWDCTQGTSESDIRLGMLIQTLHDTPTILKLGPHSLNTLRIYHNGTRWVAEIEATVNVQKEDAAPGGTGY